MLPVCFQQKKSGHKRFCIDVSQNFIKLQLQNSLCLDSLPGARLCHNFRAARTPTTARPSFVWLELHQPKSTCHYPCSPTFNFDQITLAADV